MPHTCGNTCTDAVSKIVERKQVTALCTIRCLAGMQPENLWRVCNYMASPKSTIAGFQKLVNKLRASELWWYHFGHPESQLQCLHFVGST